MASAPARRFIEFFTPSIFNRNTQMAYARGKRHRRQLKCLEPCRERGLKIYGQAGDPSQILSAQLSLSSNVICGSRSGWCWRTPAWARATSEGVSWDHELDPRVEAGTWLD